VKAKKRPMRPTKPSPASKATLPSFSLSPPRRFSHAYNLDEAPGESSHPFAFRIDVWDSAANSIVEQIAGIDDFEVAEATYRAAIARWPRARITLRQGARVVMKTWTQ
jgi:hypothetical protein